MTALRRAALVLLLLACALFAYACAAYYRAIGVGSR